MTGTKDALAEIGIAMDIDEGAAVQKAEASSAPVDPYTKYKQLERQLEFLSIQEVIRCSLLQRDTCIHTHAHARTHTRNTQEHNTTTKTTTTRTTTSTTTTTQEASKTQPQRRSPPFPQDYVKDEQKNLKRELVRAREEVKRIQSVPLVIGQFMEVRN